jgi:hypothetical protein
MLALAKAGDGRCSRRSKANMAALPNPVVDHPIAIRLDHSAKQLATTVKQF